MGSGSAEKMAEVVGIVGITYEDNRERVDYISMYHFALVLMAIISKNAEVYTGLCSIHNTGCTHQHPPVT